MSETTGDARPAILIEGARKDYGAMAGGRAEAVADVSIEVSAGAIHGLLGPNGAGKTTTLKMLLGLVHPSGGSFRILGEDASRSEARANVGFLPEQPYFPAQLTAMQALTLYGRLSGLAATEVREQAPGLLEKVGLQGQSKTLLSRFSRGMLQRFGLAQAMLGSPRVIVLDEPASGLDPVGQRDVRKLMLELSRGGTTILLSSHQLSEVETVCDEVTILNRGRVAARGHIDELLRVAGYHTVSARGDGEVPSAVQSIAEKPRHESGVWTFSIPEGEVRRVVDAFDDAGWKVESVLPTRDSLEDYFARMMESGTEGGES